MAVLGAMAALHQEIRPGDQRTALGQRGRYFFVWNVDGSRRFGAGQKQRGSGQQSGDSERKFHIVSFRVPEHVYRAKLYGTPTERLPSTAPFPRVLPWKH